jgi:hypothetical protein
MADLHAALPQVAAFNWLTLSVQVTGVVILLIYTIYTAKQVRALIASNETNRLALAETARSNEIARDALVLSRRVWLNVTIARPPIKRNESEITLVLHNVGMTPAALIEAGVTTTVQAGLHIADERPEIVPRRLAPLGVQETASYRFRADVPQDLDQLLYERVKVFHLLALVNYEDGFGGRRTMRFGWHIGWQYGNEWRTTPEECPME